MVVIAYIFNTFVNLYVLVIFVSVIMSWLIAFNVINRHNRFVDAIWRTCVALTEPALRPIRNLLPGMGGIDISPLVLLVLLKGLQLGANHYIFGPAIMRGL